MIALPVKAYEQVSRSLYSVRDANGKRIAVDLEADESEFLEAACNQHDQLTHNLEAARNRLALVADVGQQEMRVKRQLVEVMQRLLAYRCTAPHHADLCELCTDAREALKAAGVEP